MTPLRSFRARMIVGSLVWTLSLLVVTLILGAFVVHLNPHLLPFERYPAGSPLFDGIDCAPSLFGPSSFQ